MKSDPDDPIDDNVKRARVRRANPCPKCGAALGEKCFGKRGPTMTLHVERWHYEDN